MKQFRVTLSTLLFVTTLAPSCRHGHEGVEEKPEKLSSWTLAPKGSESQENNSSQDALGSDKSDLENTNVVEPKPSIREVSDLTEVTSLFLAFCPESAIVQTESGVECSQCPNEHEPPLNFDGAVIINENQAVVSVNGCTWGFNADASTAFLQKGEGGDWKMVNYAFGSSTSRCEWHVDKSAFGVCVQGTYGQGSAEMEYFGILSGDSGPKVVPLLYFVDNRNGCEFEGEFYKNVDHRLFEDVDGDDVAELVLLMTSKTGIHTGKSRPKGINDGCDDLEVGVIDAVEARIVKAYRLENGTLSAIELNYEKVRNPLVKSYIESDLAGNTKR